MCNRSRAGRGWAYSDGDRDEMGTAMEMAPVGLAALPSTERDRSHPKHEHSFITLHMVREQELYLFTGMIWGLHSCLGKV